MVFRIEQAFYGASNIGSVLERMKDSSRILHRDATFVLECDGVWY